jgi:hypothetical protein
MSSSATGATSIKPEAQASVRLERDALILSVPSLDLQTGDTKTIETRLPREIAAEIANEILALLGKPADWKGEKHLTGDDAADIVNALESINRTLEKIARELETIAKRLPPKWFPHRSAPYVW